MRVALVDNVCGCGAWKYNQALGRELAARGVDLTLVVSAEYPESSGREAFRVLRPFPCLRLYSSNLGKGIRYLFGMLAASFIILRGRFDVVHWQLFYAFPPLEAAFSWLLRITGHKTVLTIHDVQPWQAVSGRSDFFIRTIYQNASEIIVHHDVNKAALLKRYAIDGSRTHVVHHGSYLEFQGSDVGEDAASQAASDTILFFGQIKAEKGLDVLIAALPAIVAERPNAQLIIAGRPWRVDVETYLEQVHALGMDDHVVTRFQHIPDEEMDALFALAAVVTLPYRDVTQSGVVLQAMSSGRAVVVSDVGALGATVRAAQCGIVVPPGDSAALAQGILSVLRSPELARKLGQNGLEAARDDHDWGTSAQATMAVYAAADQPAPRRGAHGAIPQVDRGVG